MVKINTKIVLKDLSGKDITNVDKPFTLGEALGNIIVSGKEGGKMKLFVLGSAVYQKDNVEVDEVDLGLIKSVVKKSDTYGALITGQIEKLLEELK